MSRLSPARVATVVVAGSETPAADSAVEDVSGVSPGDTPGAARRLALALLAGSPRVASVGPRLARVDARGWNRRGGEPALGRTLRRAASEAGFTGVGVGIADVPIAADAAARLSAVRGAPGPRGGSDRGSDGRSDGGAADAGADTGGRIVVVPPGGARAFLAPFPLSVLPLPEELAETFRALGFRRVAEIADRPLEEFEARFGPAGVRAHRLARGEDERAFRALDLPDLPEASLELDTPADTLEPLLFVLRHLLARLCADLSGSGRCVAHLELVLGSARGRRTATAVPARPTHRERLLYDLCRAALERAAGAADRLDEPVEELGLRVVRLAAPDARQEDLFTRRWRDPLAAAAALSRLRVRLGEESVVHPEARPEHRPESRSAWRPVEMVGAAGGAGAEGSRGAVVAAGASRGADASGDGRHPAEPIPGVLHLLPEPRPLRVRTERERPVELWDGPERREIVVAEGPERLSGDWWTDPYHREYFRICTEEGALLWLFREYRRTGEFRWWLHGWWD